MPNWKTIKHYTKYEVSDTGEIRNKVTGRCLKQSLRNKKGYLALSLVRDDGQDRSCSSHRLVAVAFIPNPENLPEVNHKDGIKIHNFKSNLEWCTTQDNVAHAWDTGLAKPKLSQDEVDEVRRLYDKSEYGIQTRLAKQFKVTQQLISIIVRNPEYRSGL